MKSTQRQNAKYHLFFVTNIKKVKWAHIQGMKGITNQWKQSEEEILSGFHSCCFTLIFIYKKSFWKIKLKSNELYRTEHKNTIKFKCKEQMTTLCQQYKKDKRAADIQGQEHECCLLRRNNRITTEGKKETQSRVLPSRFSRVRPSDPIDTAHRAPLSLGFSRQEHWSGLPFPSPQSRILHSGGKKNGLWGFQSQEIKIRKKKRRG